MGDTIFSDFINFSTEEFYEISCSEGGVTYTGQFACELSDSGESFLLFCIMLEK